MPQQILSEKKKKIKKRCFHPKAIRKKEKKCGVKVITTKEMVEKRFFSYNPTFFFYEM